MSPPLDQPGALNAAPATATNEQETVVQLLEEELSVDKRVIETGRVKVSRVTHSHEQIVDELLHHEKVEVERIPVDRPIEVMPSIRQEGDVTIVPVVEEILRVERGLVLKEEVHIRRIKTIERHQQQVTLRRQEATVSRSPITVPAEETQPTPSNPEKENS